MNQKGFTLVELLVAIGVVGALVLAALTQFEAYKTRSFDVLARADLRNAANAEEGYFINFTTYQTCNNTGCVTGPNALEGLEGINPYTILSMSGTSTSFTGTSTQLKGTGITYSWNSNAGGMVNE